MEPPSLSLPPPSLSLSPPSLSLSRRLGLLSLSLPPSLSLPLFHLSLSRPPSLSRLPLSPSSYLGDTEPAAGYLPTPAAAPQRCFVTGLENSSALLESLDSAAASVAIEDKQMRRIEQMRKVFLSPALSLSHLPPSRALSCMRAYARLTGRRRKISLASPLSSCLLATEIASVARRGGRRKVFLSPALSLSLSLSPPSLSSSLLHAGICALNGKEEENFSSLSPALFPLLASPRVGNCFRREKRREEESLPLSRLPPSRALSCMRAYAR